MLLSVTVIIIASDPIMMRAMITTSVTTNIAPLSLHLLFLTEKIMLIPH
jgi:hypothetical protein